MQKKTLILALVLLGVFAVTAQAHQFEWTLINQTNQTMTLVEDSLTAGKWVTKPPAKLSNNHHGELVAESKAGIMTGISGRIVYELDNSSATRFVLTFVDPVMGNTSAGVSTNTGNYVVLTHIGAGGESATSIFDQILGDSNEWFDVTVNNQSGNEMTVSDKGVSRGKWETQPKTNISNNAGNGWKAAGTSGTWTGVQGFVTYQINDGSSTKVHIKFYKPYDGSGYYSTALTGSSAGNYKIVNKGYVCCDSDHNAILTTVSRVTSE